MVTVIQKENKQKKVLFVCAENAGRSQMAGAFFNHYADGANFIAESSGTIPAERVNSVVVEAMREKDIDIKNARPKRFDPKNIEQYDRVISFGCLVKEAFSKEVQDKIEDWLIDDPKGKSLAEIRKIRDEIEARIKELLRDIQGSD